MCNMKKNIENNHHFPNIIDENQVVETEQCLVKIQVYSTINVPANYSGKTYLYYHLVKNKIQDWMFYLVINLCINLFVILYFCSQMRFKLVLYLLTMSVPDEGYCRNASR